MKDNTTINRFFGHLKTTLTHKMWVSYYCNKAGIPWRGFVHDLSKFSPTEFFEGVKYYTGTSSPIDGCKKELGYSNAWFHHRGRNKHHYEYWTDNYDKGTTSNQMPFIYALEMLCDYLGAGRAYNKSKFTIEGELKWWENKKQIATSMHPKTKTFIDVSLKLLCEDMEYLKKNVLYTVYNMIDADVPAEIILITLKEFKTTIKPMVVHGDNYLGFIAKVDGHKTICYHDDRSFFFERNGEIWDKRYDQNGVIKKQYNGHGVITEFHEYWDDDKLKVNNSTNINT